MTKREKNLIRITLAIAVLCIIFFVVIDPLFNWWNQKYSHAKQIDVEYDKFKEDVAMMESLYKSCSLYKEKLGNSKINLGRPKVVIESIESVNKLLGQGGLGVSSMRPGPLEKSRNKILPTMMLYVSGTTKFDKIIKTLDELEHGDITCNPVKLDLTLKDENRDDLNVDMQIKIYLWPENIEPPLPEKEENNAKVAG